MRDAYTDEEFLAALDAHRPTIIEYALLASKATLSDANGQRVNEILEQAKYDDALYFLIEEVDVIIAEKQSRSSRKEVQDDINLQQEKLGVVFQLYRLLEGKI